MRKHREHRFDNSQTGGFMVTPSVFMQLFAGVSDYHEKILYLILGLISGVRLILECDLCSNKYNIRTLIIFVCNMKKGKIFPTF